MIWLLKLRSPYFCGSEKVSFPTCWLMIIGVFFCSRYWELSYSIWGPPYQPTIISGIFSILNSFAYDRGLCQRKATQNQCFMGLSSRFSSNSDPSKFFEFFIPPLKPNAKTKFHFENSISTNFLPFIDGSLDYGLVIHLQNIVKRKPLPIQFDG